MATAASCALLSGATFLHSDHGVRLPCLRNLTFRRSFIRFPSLISATASAQIMAPEEEKVRSGHSQKGFLQFSKFHGLGNDFIMVDNRESMDPKITPNQAIKLCNRNFGVGADGVIFALPGSNGSDYTMRIYNSDGSEPEMCGNGIRCMARFLAILENTSESRRYKIDTLAGLIIPHLQHDGQVIVDMGAPILNARDVPTTLPPGENGAVVSCPLNVNGKTWKVTCVSMGNPHCITFSDGDGKTLDVNGLLFGGRNIWVDHNSLSNCHDGLIDAIMASTAITISNNLLTHHNKTMLLGHNDDYIADKSMQVTIAFNHFGEGLVQRMPRCRHGYFEIVNNDYTHWKMYAVGGSASPTISSMGNRFIAPFNPFAKQVTMRIDASQDEWESWDWRSEGDLFLNGAYFTPSGKESSANFQKAISIGHKSSAVVGLLTSNAGAMSCQSGSPC